MDVLRLNHVSKSFGCVHVLENLDFAVPEHGAFGFIGKNGAGKTTTMKMILGFLRPDAGTIEVCGEPVIFGSARANRVIGYLPDVPEFYGYMKPTEYLSLCGRIAGMKPEQIRAKSLQLLEMVGLEGVNRRIQGFSRGMKQRLGIAQALLNDPKLLICDEPTSALDPVGRKEVLDLLAQACRHTTLVFSTHILSDVERVCDTIGILDGGRLKLEGNLNQIRDTYRRNTVRLELADAGGLAGAAAGAEKLPEVASVERREGEKVLLIRLKNGESTDPVLKMAAEQKLAVLRYEVLEPSLEDVFLEVVE